MSDPTREKADAKAAGKGRFMAWSAAGLLFGIAAAAGLWRYAGGRVWTDGRDLRTPASRSQPREVLWTAPKALDESFNTADQEYEPSVSPDGTELYFVRGKAARNADVYVSRRRNNQWTPPEPVAAVNGAYDDLGPRLTADGQFLLFYSDRPGGAGQYDVWAAPRLPNGEWGEPFNLGPSVNSEFNEYNPAPTPDGKHLIFATNRKAASAEQKEAWRATIRQGGLGDYDLFISALQPSPGTQPSAATLRFGPAAEVPGVNTPYHEGASCVSPAGDFLYFASNRPGGFGKFDLYRSRILPDGADGSPRFGTPENVGSDINTGDNDTDPQLALGGFHLLFSSDRPRTGGYDLFAADSREVFAERQGRPLPTLGWSGWVLLASVLLLIPLLRFFRGWNDHHLNVIQKCLLVSVLLHVLFTIGLSFVAVTHEVIAFAKQEMGIGEVAVGADGARDVEIGLAIRAGGGGAGLPVAAEAPPGIEQRASTPEEVSQRPQTFEAGAPAAGASGGVTLDAAPVGVRSTVVAASDRFAAATPPDGGATPDVTVSVSAPLRQAEAAVPAAAEGAAAERLPAGVAPAAGPSELRLAAGPAHASAISGESMATAPETTRRPGAPAPEPVRPSTTVVYADASPEVGAPAATIKVRSAEPGVPPVAAAEPGVAGAGVLARAASDVPAVAGRAPAVEVGAPAAAASGGSMLGDDPRAGSGGAGTGAGAAARATPVAPNTVPVAGASDNGGPVVDVTVAAPTAGGRKISPTPGAPGATTEEPVAITRTSGPGSTGGEGAAPGKNGPPLLMAAAPAQPGAESSISRPALPTTRPIDGPSTEAGKMRGAGLGASALAPAVAPASLSVGGLPGQAGARVATAPEVALATSRDADLATVPQAKQNTTAAEGGTGVIRPNTGAIAGPAAAPTRASASASLASAAAMGPRSGFATGTSVPPAMPSPLAPGSGVEGPAVSIIPPPGGAAARVGRPGVATEGAPSAAEAVVASQRVRPAEGLGHGPSGGIAAGGLTAAPIAPAKLPAGGAGTGASLGNLRPAPGDVAAVPLDLEVAVTAPDLGAPAPLSQRAPEARKPLLEKWGGTRQSEDAVERALDYLARQQEPDGRWTYVERGSKPGEREPGSHDMALTGLATLAFLAADHTPAHDGPYRDAVAAAVNYLVTRQRANGDLRGAQAGGGADAGNMYDQGIATLALSEAALMTGDARTVAAATSGARFIVKAQNRETGGWRYLPGEYGDTSVFGWQIMALHSARQLGFEVPEKTREGALRYVALAAAGRSGALAGYQPNSGPSQPMTAELLFARILLGDAPTAAAEREAADYLTQRLPDARRADFYGWYYGSLSLLQLQNDAWKKWNERTRETLLKMQKRGGQDDGCWTGNIQWADRGGRVYTTALGALTLEVYYRYLPLGNEGDANSPQPASNRARPNVGYLPK